jgi:hypothetical protein
MNAELQLEPMRSKAVWGGRIRYAAVLGILLATSCSQSIRNGQASSYLVMTSLTGGSDNDATVESDVVSDTGSIFTDVGTATLQLVMKDTTGGPGPSPINNITVTQYQVEYVRTDGRNTPGVDVPFGFTSGATATISGTGTVSFTLVRIQAKEEAPLKALRQGGGAQAISVVAKITFYGHDQSGREVSVTGNLDVTFADWAG